MPQIAGLTDDEQDVFARLHNLLLLSRGTTIRLNDYLEGDRKLLQLGLALPPDLLNFSVILNWPRTVVEAIEQRLDVAGFRLPGKPADTYLQQVWQYNDLDELQVWAYQDALALARSYVCVGSNEEDPDFPIVTVESPLEMAALRDPATRRVTAALRLYSDQPASGQASAVQDTHGTLYLPDRTIWFETGTGAWQMTGLDEHRLGLVPVAPMVNRQRATRRTGAFVEGVSEMVDVIPIAESASRAVTNAQLAQETHAVPHRAILGATKSDFYDSSGQPLPAFQTYFGAITALTNPDSKMVQFDASNLQNFETMVNLYARLASGVAGMPVEYFGLNTQNAPSAEGQRAGDTRLIKRAERRQVTFGHAWESAMRIVLAFKNGRSAVQDPELRGLEAIWTDAGTPTRAQTADAVSKLHASGLLDWETAQEDLGRTPAEIAIMKARRQADMDLAIGAGVQAALVAGVADDDVLPAPTPDVGLTAAAAPAAAAPAPAV